MSAEMIQVSQGSNHVAKSEFVAGHEGSKDVAPVTAHVTISEKDLLELGRLGVFVQKEGVGKIIRGTAVVHQQRLEKMVEILTAAVLDLAKKTKKTNKDHTCMAQLSSAIGQLSAKLTASQHLLMEVEESPSIGRVEDDEILNKSFLPGQIIDPSEVCKPVFPRQGIAQ